MGVRRLPEIRPGQTTPLRVADLFRGGISAARLGTQGRVRSRVSEIRHYGRKHELA
jgi:hypothetical protein